MLYMLQMLQMLFIYTYYSPSLCLYPSLPSQVIDELMGKWIDDVSTLASQVARARTMASSSSSSYDVDIIDGSINTAALLTTRPLILASDIALVLREVWPVTLEIPAPTPLAPALDIRRDVSGISHIEEEEEENVVRPVTAAAAAAAMEGSSSVSMIGEGGGGGGGLKRKRPDSSKYEARASAPSPSPMSIYEGGGAGAGAGAGAGGGTSGSGVTLTTTQPVATQPLPLLPPVKFKLITRAPTAQ